MSGTREVRADFDRESIVVYQAYPDAIADVAVKQQKFGPPFSLGRMTWIKPSFLWLMHRSNWGRKSGQERTMRHGCVLLSASIPCPRSSRVAWGCSRRH